MFSLHHALHYIFYLYCLFCQLKNKNLEFLGTHLASVTLFSERIFEDHENLVENLLNWTRDSQNKLMFIERIEKYALFKNPQVRPFTSHA